MKETVDRLTVEKYIKFLGDNDFITEFLNLEQPKTNKKDRHDVLSDSEQETDSGDIFMFQKSPTYITHELRDYQISGVNWLINMHEKQINAILADEMGLGKTLQTITLLGFLKFIKKEKGSNLIIVPKSTLQNWKNEFTKYMPDYKAKIFHASKYELLEKSKFLKNKKFDACITTYEMCLKARKYLKKVNWNYLIIDEAHRIKNENSILSNIVRLFSCKHRLLLTGTPLQNNIKELWALLNFVVPEVFFDSEKFEEWVKKSGEDEKSIAQLRAVLQAFFLRREKIDVEKNLLPKKIINLYANMTDMQKLWYKMVIQKDLTPILGLKEKKVLLMNVLMQLRKVCNHPYLFPEAEPGPPYTTDEHLIDNCGKMVLLDKLLKKLKAQGSRVLIFSQMSRVLDILEDYCDFREYKFCRIDGSTSSEDRISSIEEFNKDDSEIFIFLLTTRAGGLGINLATADTVILYDTDWNPQIDLQAQDRAHRIGQKKQVYVYRLITENSVEEKIVLRSLQKLKLDEILLQKKEKPSKELNQAELLDILASGVEKIDETVEVIDDIDLILKKGEEKTRDFENELNKINLQDLTAKSSHKYNYTESNVLIDKIISTVPPIEQRKRKSLFVTTRKPELYNMPFYQFYPAELQKLQKKELEYYERNLDFPEDLKKKKKDLLLQGFDWTKKDYISFVKAMCVVGKNNTEKIANILEKDVEEVKKYHTTFWERIDEIPEADKIKNQVEKAEEQVSKNHLLKSIYENLKQNENFSIALATNTRSKFYPEYVDKFLLDKYIEYCDTSDPGQSIFIDLHKSPLFKFNYFILNRNNSDIMRRINTLINGLLREEFKKGKNQIQ